MRLGGLSVGGDSVTLSIGDLSHDVPLDGCENDGRWNDELLAGSQCG